MRRRRAYGQESERVSLREIFLGVQESMIGALRSHSCIRHDPTKGALTEQSFIDMLNAYMPRRYQVGQGLILDSEGRCSQQIDIVIYDRQYSPFLFRQGGMFYIPAESVYAVLEVKQELKTSTMQYAGGKINSVRSLTRTTGLFRSAGALTAPPPPIRILGGIVTVHSYWDPPFAKEFHRALGSMGEGGRIDLVCSLQAGAADVRYKKDGTIEVGSGGADVALVFFFLHLLARLQEVGTVAAMDFRAYAKGLEEEGRHEGHGSCQPSAFSCQLEEKKC